MDAVRLRVREIGCFERPVRFRMPFRFGSATMTEMPQAFVRVRVRLEDGRESWGQAAELMAPKWFDKSPELSNDDNADQLRRAVRHYGELLLSSDLDTAFGHYAAAYHPHLAVCRENGLNPLVASFGPALIDRAVLDALCRIHGLGFADAMHANLPAMAPQRLVGGFEDVDFGAFLAGLEPRRTVAARHTVGLVDPLTAADQNPGDRLDDGLPETLEEVIARYGNRYFKIKVGGDVAADLERLLAIAAVLDAASASYDVTLDGNEQYRDLDQLHELIAAVRADPKLERFSRSVLFLEQPIHRDRALAEDLSGLSASWPVIIDESDEDLGSFPAARGCGYSGVSSKSCKGFYKALINLARCRMWSTPEHRFLMSAEDLSCQAGLSLQQDLALVSLLGIEHVERNGHHYARGMAGVPEAEQAAFLAAHPDTYERIGDSVCLRVVDGMIETGSLAGPGYGTRVEPDWNSMAPMGA